MAEQINLSKMDTATGTQNLHEDFVLWVSNMVDTYNGSMTTIENAFNNMITSLGVDIGGGGAGPITVPVVGLTPTGFVQAVLISSSNPVTILSVVPGLNGFDITFSGNPGASAIIKYTAYTAAP